jgi:hypothetical protein
LVSVVGITSLAFGVNLGNSVFEPRFVQNDKVLEELGRKYNFTVFDFALAKKESHLKQLRR